MSDESEERFKRIDASQERINADLRVLVGMQGKRIFYRKIVDDAVDLNIKIYPGLLNDEQKRQLEAAEKILFDLSDDVVEETTRRIKTPPIRQRES